MQTIGQKLEALYMLPNLSREDYLLLEPSMNVYKVHKDFTDKQKELILVLYQKYFNE